MSQSRQMWTLFEPVHAVTYFADEAREAYVAAGLRGFWRGYFAGRAAPLGTTSGGPGAGVVTAAVLFMCIPWIAHRFSSIDTLVNVTPLEKEGEVYVFGGRRMTGFLVIEDGMPLREDTPSIHLAQFATIIRESNLEFYQDLIYPVLPPLPFGFVFAPRLEKGSSSLYQYIVPAEVIERRDVGAWHFDLKRWGYRPGGYGEYWFYVPKAEPWP